jgi:hypothetical protein
MAAGDRKIKISTMNIQNGNPVVYDVQWGYFIEDKVGVDQYVRGGSTNGSLGNTAAFNALTGSQIKTNVVAAINADPNVPAKESVS